MPSRPTERANRITNHSTWRNLPAIAAAAIAPFLTLGAPAQAQSKSITNETAKLLASDGTTGDQFGQSVAISGDTLVVGATGDDDNGITSGSAYVFVRDARGFWTQQAKLIAQDGATIDSFGLSVAISGNTAIIGARLDDDNGVNSGSAYVFVCDSSGTWTQLQKLLATDGAEYDLFGESIAIDRDTVVIGARGHLVNKDQTGSVYVFTRGPFGFWRQNVKLQALDATGRVVFGKSVAIDGDIIAVGALTIDNNMVGPGTVFTFERGATSIWTQQAKLIAPDGEVGNAFGSNIAISNRTIIIGTPFDDDNGINSGSAYIFARDRAGIWTQEAKLLAPDGTASDSFGSSVAITHDIAVVGSFRGDSNNGVDTGSVYIFTHVPHSIWRRKSKFLASDGAAFDHFGRSLAISSSPTVLVGSPFNRDNNGFRSGAAYIFDLDDDAHSDDDADFDDDGKVDSDDLSSLLSQWGAQGGSADLNKDGTVDSADLAILLANWG